MTTDLLIGDGERYELLGEVASGGMATVYLARMRRPMGFSRLVAVKAMHPQFAKDESFVSMFMDEARLTARLRHPNIVPTVDIVADDGHLLLVMEYVEGASLAHLLRTVNKARTRIPVPIACAIMHDALLGLHDAHQAKDDEGAPLAIIHRDVSPQNVLVGLDGLSRVLDFGVAKARQNTHRSNDNEIKGKVPYMPPEQLFGEAIDHRVDVYAAGVSLWEAIVGERLFDGPCETALVKKISEEPVPRASSKVPELTAAVDDVIVKALEREPGKRWESALAMAEAIARAIPLPTRTEVSTWIRQHVAAREVSSNTKMPARALLGAPTTSPAHVDGNVDSSVTSKLGKVDTNPATTILALLEKASMVRGSAKRPVPEAMDSVAGMAMETGSFAPVTAARRSRAARVAIGLAAVAFGFAGVAVVRVANSAVLHAGASPQTPPPGRAEAALPSPGAPVPAANTTPAAPLPVSEEEPKAAAVTARATTSVRSAARPAGKSTTATAVVAKAETHDTGAKKDCKSPFTIDAQGHKHFKAECIP